MANYYYKSSRSGGLIKVRPTDVPTLDANELANLEAQLVAAGETRELEVYSSVTGYRQIWNGTTFVEQGGGVQTELDPVFLASEAANITGADITNLSNLGGINNGDEVQATETVLGIAEIATQPEVHTGTDDLKFITPLKLDSEKGIPDGIAPLDATGKIDGSYLAGGGKSMVVSFAAGTVKSLDENSTSYVAKADMIYAGSDTVGTIVAIKATIWKDSVSGATGEIRIIDKSNANVICELTGITNLDDSTVLDLGTLTNIPTTPTTFEIQMSRSTGANRTIFCSSLEIVY